MNNLKYKFSQFMIGRYGTDELSRFLLITYSVILIINAFVHSAKISLALWIILIYTIFRTFSKNISARRSENGKYLEIKRKVSSPFKKGVKPVRDRYHIYKKCPHCKATLRFPRKKGKHNAICPRCKNSMKVNVWFEYKKTINQGR